MIDKIISAYVEKACGKSDNVLTNSFFAEHILVVEEYAKRLAGILKADNEIVSLSAFLHDISAVLDFSSLPNHNIESARIASELLAENAYSRDKIERVSQCIVNHILPIELGKGTLEEVCLSNADAMSQITNPGYWLYFAFRIKNMNYDEGRTWYLSRINDHWTKLIDPARKLVESDFAKVMELL
jgi:uncharacterized protein